MSALPSEIDKPAPWRMALPALVALLLGIGLLFRDTALVMAGIWWRSETFAHCMLVVPMMLWLVWRKRDALATMSPRPQPWVLALMVAVAAFWLVSQMAVVNAASQFAFVTLLILAVPAVLGLQVAHAILFPLLFLYFAVPFGEFMLPPMMEWTADFTVWALRTTGIPVFREGQNFVIPSGHWSVIDECSGVRYVMASFLVGSLFAYLNYRSYRKRAVFMLVALLLPVLANWFRAYMIVMLGHLSGNRLAVGVDHILYGWVFFGLIVFGMFSVGSRWADPDEPAAGAGGAPALPAPAGLIWGTAIGALLVALLPHAALTALIRSERAAAPATLVLPQRLADGWTTDGAAATAFKPLVENPSLEVAQAYRGPAGTVSLHVAYFRGQDKERKLVNSQHLLVAMRDREWALPVHGAATTTLQGQETKLRSSEILSRDNNPAVRRARLHLWRLYWVDGRFIAGDAQTKLAGIAARLRGHGDEGALVLMVTDAESKEAADTTLGAFLKANEAPLNDLLKKTQLAR